MPLPEPLPAHISSVPDPGPARGAFLRVQWWSTAQHEAATGGGADLRIGAVVIPHPIVHIFGLNRRVHWFWPAVLTIHTSKLQRVGLLGGDGRGDAAGGHHVQTGGRSTMREAGQGYGAGSNVVPSPVPPAKNPNYQGPYTCCSQTTPRVTRAAPTRMTWRSGSTRALQSGANALPPVPSQSNRWQIRYWPSARTLEPKTHATTFVIRPQYPRLEHPTLRAK